MDETEARIFLEAVRLLYARSRIAHATLLLVAALVALVFWTHAEPVPTLAWLAAVWVLALWRLRLAWGFSRRAPTPADAGRWARLFVLGSGLTGIAWGAGALLFYPHAPLAYQIFLAFVVGGLCAGAASSDASHPRAFLAFAFPALLPLVAQFLASGDAPRLAMGALSALFGVATGFISRWGGDAVREALRARFGNERLLDSLRESGDRLRLALAAANQTEWEFDVAQEVLTIGPRDAGAGVGVGERRLGRAEWAALVHPDDRAEATAQVERCVRGACEPYESEYRARTLGAGQGWRWVRARGRVTHRDEAGRVQKLMGTMMDVTEIHALQEKLVEAARLASLGTLTAGVAHEINNPLAWVSSNLSFVLDRLGGGASSAPSDPQLQEPLREAMIGVERIGAVVKALRSLARAREDDEVCDVDVQAELAEALRMVRNQLVQRAALVVEVPEGLPPTRAVPGELSRVFLNLLVNAGHAIAPGKAEENRIAVTAHAAGPELVIEVADTGHGMTPQVCRRIFEPFFTTKPVGEGSGLGLAIVRSIVEASGGRIEAESERGRGALFRVHLPVATRHDVASGPAAQPAVAPAERLRVLIVDDEPLVAQALVRQLAPEAEAEAVGSAAEALRRVEAGEEWHAVLCDLMMPSMDGIAFYEALAARAPAWLDRVVFMTGGAFGGRAEQFVAETDVPVVAKPAEKAQLLKVLASVAHRRARQQAGEAAEAAVEGAAP